LEHSVFKIKYIAGVVKLDFEDAMFQELQDGWITQAEFDAVQDYVLGYSLGDDGSNANFNPNDYNFDPIGAFYDSQSATFDNAQSIASNQPSQTSPEIGRNERNVRTIQLLYYFTESRCFGLRISEESI
jgi:hypothetical protein